MKIFDGKKIQNFSKAKMFFNRSNKWLKLMFCLMSPVELVGLKKLMGFCESSRNEDAKIGIGCFSSSNTSRENQLKSLRK